MKMNPLKIENERNSIDILIISLLTLLCYGYLGILRSRYNYIVVLSLMLLLLIVALKKFVLRRVSPLWGALYIYIFLNAVFLNPQQGIKYVIVLSLGLILLNISRDIAFYEKLLNVFGVISIIFAFATIINSFYPDIIIKLFGFIIPQDQVETYRFNLSWGGFPGLAGELSFNAFCLSIGFAAFFGKIISKKEHKITNILFLILIYYSITLTAKRSFMLIIPAIVCIYLYAIFFNKAKDKRRFLILSVISLF